MDRNEAFDIVKELYAAIGEVDKEWANADIAEILVVE